MRMLATAMAVALSAAVASDAQARVEVPPWVVVPVYGGGQSLWTNYEMATSFCISPPIARGRRYPG